jgi:hypothetical protein
MRRDKGKSVIATVLREHDESMGPEASVDDEQVVDLKIEGFTDVTVRSRNSAFCGNHLIVTEGAWYGKFSSLSHNHHIEMPPATSLARAAAHVCTEIRKGQTGMDCLSKASSGLPTDRQRQDCLDSLAVYSRNRHAARLRVKPLQREIPCLP